MTEARLVNRLIVTTSANAVIALTGLVTGVLVARSIGPSGAGELASIQLIPTLVATIAVIGMPEALVFLGARSSAKAKAYLATSLVMALVATSAMAVLAYPILPLAMGGAAGDTVEAARLYLLIGPILVFHLLPVQLLRAAGRRAWNGLRLLPSLGWLGVILSSEQISPIGLAHRYMLTLLVVGVLTTSVCLLLIHGPFRLSPSLVRPLLGYGVPAAAVTLPMLLNVRIDQVLLVGLASSRELGLYAAAAAIGVAVNFMTTAVGLVMSPQIAAADQATALRLFARGGRLSVLVCVSASSMVGLSSIWLLPRVFGLEYLDARTPAVVLSVASGVWGFNHYLEEGLRGLNRQREIILAEVVGLAATILLAITFLEVVGLVGLATGSLLGYLATTCVLLSSLKSSFGLRWVSLVPTRQDVVDVLEAGRRKT